MEQIDNGFVKNVTGHFYQSLVIYECFEGFSFNTTDTLHCQSDGEWRDASDREVICKGECAERDTCHVRVKENVYEKNNLYIL